MLDFGCMDGIFTLRLQQLGGEAVGYDISPGGHRPGQAIPRAAARARCSPPCRPGPGQFDRIYCNEVLEHVEDDSALVGELVGYLAPGGSVVGTTPVGKHFWDPDHKRQYDEALLRAGAGSAGAGCGCTGYYRSPLRNFVPLRQKGAAVFIFEVTPPSPPGAR